MRFSKNEMNKASKTIRASLKKNNTLPSFVTMKDMDGKKHDISKPQYAGLFENNNTFWLSHNRAPNFVTYKNKANNPLVWIHQKWSHSCCCASLSMASMMLYNYTTESKCCEVLGTAKTTTGTSPSALLNKISKIGMKATIIPRNLQSVKNSLLKNRPVIAHIDSSKASCLSYSSKTNFGHYILIYDVNGNNYKVADPLRGLKQCKSSVLDNSMKGRKINYYSISLA